MSSEERIFQVVVNHEQQHSTWPVDKPLLHGWTAVGVQGTKASCLDYIEQAWTDMRPLSVRGAA